MQLPTKTLLFPTDRLRRLAKILLFEKIYRKDATIFMARAAPAGGQGLRG